MAGGGVCYYRPDLTIQIHLFQTDFVAHFPPFYCTISPRGNLPFFCVSLWNKKPAHETQTLFAAPPVFCCRFRLQLLRLLRSREETNHSR